MDKFHTIQIKEPILSMEIRIIIDFLLDHIVQTVSYTIKHFSKNIEEKIPEKHFWMTPTFCTELLKNLIKRYPPLLVYLLEYKIANEIILENFSSFTFLFEMFQKKIKIQNGKHFLDFIDFLFITYPYNSGISQELLIQFISYNYYFKNVEDEGQSKHLISSSDLWKSNIFQRCIKEFRMLLDSKQIFTDFNLFLQFYHLQMVLIVLLNTPNLQQFSSSKESQILDQFISRELFDICLMTIKECQQFCHYPLLNINGVFITFFKKVYNRCVKIVIAQKKTSAYQKKDMQYLKSPKI